MKNYTINIDSWTVDGGYCDLFPITDSPSLGFKQFYNKKRAISAYKIQKQLSSFDLAPQVVGYVCQLKFYSTLIDTNELSNWGYITELADCNLKKSTSLLVSIQQLVNTIKDRTSLKFWDCHDGNIGYIIRNKKPKLVCIDTGKESFDPNINAWGFIEPGPECPYCLKYDCKCSTVYDCEE